MDMVAVDPRLFVMCRLCLDDTGMYQIVPSVQQQIKYCFDIDVEPFDGLPQLICKKCESILSEFNITKRKFVEKQNGLKTKDIEIKSSSSPQQEAVSSSQQNDTENKDIQKENSLIGAVYNSSQEKNNDNKDLQKEESLIRAENSPSQQNNDFQKENYLIHAETSSAQKKDIKNKDFQKEESLVRAENSPSQQNNDFQKENSLIRAETSSTQKKNIKNKDFQKEESLVRAENSPSQQNNDFQKENSLIRAKTSSTQKKKNKNKDFQKEESLIRAENSPSQQNNDFQKENSLIRAETSSTQKKDIKNKDFQKEESLIRAENSPSEQNNDIQKENSLIRAETSSNQKKDVKNKDFQKDNSLIRDENSSSLKNDTDSNNYQTVSFGGQNIRTNKRSNSILSSTCNDLEDRDVTPAADENKLQKKRRKTLHEQWEAYFNKRFVCGICKKSNKKKNHLIRHLKRHRKLLASYDSIFKTRCIVKMNKVDDYLNMTGSEHTVVINPRKILCAQGKNYYTIYSAKELPSKTESDLTKCAKVETYRNSVSSDDDVCLKRPHTKRRRILSRSSNETVILGDNYKNSLSETDIKPNTIENKEPQNLDMELINVDDSSDNDSYKGNMDLKSTSESNKPFKVKVTDYKAIQNITSMSQSKYIKKKFELFENDVKNSASSEQSLKHKILSIGRKVINNQGFNCTGLLRYMEYKNLEIKWTPTNSMTTGSTNKDSNYVRIMPRLRGTDKSVSDNNLGWKYLPENHGNGLLEDNSNDLHNKAVTSVEQSDFKANNLDAPVESTTAPINDQLNENDTLDAVLYTPDAVLCNNASEPDVILTKLLNSNPVANPKKLPKKSNVTETKTNLKEKSEGPSSMKQNVQPPICITIDDEMQGSNLCMPIITSTTSLAAFSSHKQENNENINHSNTVSNNHASHEPETSSTPRIKVKPVSELMPDRVLNNLNQQQSVVSSNIWNIQNQSETVTSPYPNTVNDVYMQGKEAQVQDATLPVPAIVPISIPSVVSTELTKIALPQATRDYVTLNTVELPNTKTDSPIKYFKTLLQIHNINLLVSNENLSRDFACIIKFKVTFNQGALVLCLSLQCSKNTFCFGVKGRDPGDNIDITTLSAIWQWEILKQYKGESVGNKLLQNAQQISQEVYEYTKTFLCLLKSIDFRTET